MTRTVRMTPWQERQINKKRLQRIKEHGGVQRNGSQFVSNTRKKKSERGGRSISHTVKVVQTPAKKVGMVRTPAS